MYDTKEFKLAKPRKLSFREIKEFAKYEFNIHYPEGVNFIKYGNIGLEDGMYKSVFFLLHQSCERFYNAISLTFTNYRPKSHKLNELGAQVKEFSRELAAIFPKNTPFEERCYDLLCRAYIEARYNGEFAVTKEELTYMIERVEILKTVTASICQEKIASYDALIEQEESIG